MLGGLLGQLVTLLRRARRRSLSGIGRTPPTGSNRHPPTEDASAEEAVVEGMERIVRVPTPQPCDDVYAALDLAGLEAGSLSRREVRRLARHVRRCETCRIVLMMIVVESAPAEGTGKHAVPTEWMERIRT